MKQKTFTVTDADKRTYTFPCTQRTLDIYDNRWVQSKDFDPIHYTFFEQMTRQISPQIQRMLGVELPASFNFTAVDKHVVKKEDCFYMAGTLSGKGGTDYLWVKCGIPYDPSVLRQEIHGVVFQVCDAEESRECSIKRIGAADYGTTWIKKLTGPFGPFGPKKSKQLPPPSDYPDVTLRIHMKPRINEIIQKEIYDLIAGFIVSWNSHAKDESHIHDSWLCDEYESNHVVYVYVDFGSSDPLALKELLDYLPATDSRIKNVTI